MLIMGNHRWVIFSEQAVATLALALSVALVADFGAGVGTHKGGHRFDGGRGGSGLCQGRNGRERGVIADHLVEIDIHVTVVDTRVERVLLLEVQLHVGGAS
jgi:hypothetical protein